ncbi:MAG: hypothetical protein AAFX10_15765 [Pseudomonadota bacterium]
MSLVRVLIIAVVAMISNNPALAGTGQPCQKTTNVLRLACYHDAADDKLTQRANCLNLTASDRRLQCLRESRQTFREALGECNEVRRARRALCRELGGAAYDPPFGEDFAGNFVDPREIGVTVAPNPWLPLTAGSEWRYEKTFEEDGEEVTESIVVTVTEATKRIDGIDCVVVRDVVEVDGDLLEDTADWYAQDIHGNVWYCGEVSENFEVFDGDDPETPELVDLDGSWKAGRDGAKAGILLPFAPLVGETIRQEVAWAEAEDVIEIVSVSGSESAPAAGCDGTCLVTRDFTPLEPDADEFKYYVPGIGLIVEVDPETGERLELQSFSQP